MKLVQTLVAAALFAVSGVAAASNTETFLTADIDSDGRVSWSEFFGVFPFLELEAMDMADYNADGFLSADEFIAAQLPVIAGNNEPSPIGGRMDYDSINSASGRTAPLIAAPIAGQLIELPPLFFEDELQIQQFRRVQDILGY